LSVRVSIPSSPASWASRYEDDDEGALFRVAEPKTGKHPTFTGVCTIDGRKYRIAGWERDIQKGERAGERYLKLKFTLAEEQPTASRSSTPSDDDIPF
jgi:hypothetical protein